MNALEITFNETIKNVEKDQFRSFSIEEAKRIYKYHKTIPEYNETPFVLLNNLSKYYGISNMFVKDESFRFGLNSFKALGGSYAIGKILSDKLGITEPNFKEIMENKEKLGNLTVATATDGNHGRGVAWTCEQFSLKSVIYMPKGSKLERINNIKKHGAKVIVTDLNYDDTVRLVRAEAEKNGWIIVQDTAWHNYTDVPLWIMQGYLTLAYESYLILAQQHIEPTHIFVQAGVGAFAGAIAAFFSQIYKNDLKIVLIEPEKAACFYESIRNKKPTKVSGDLDTIMAGLACGEVNPIGWEILKDVVWAFIKCKDFVSANGMRILSNPLGDDLRIISGESGAVSVGVIDCLCKRAAFSKIREQLNITDKSNVLIVSTEGATDTENFKNIVWYGKYSDPII